MNEILLDPLFNVEYPSVIEGCKHFLAGSSSLTFQTSLDSDVKRRAIISLIERVSSPGNTLLYDSKLVIDNKLSEAASRICEFVTGERSFESHWLFTEFVMNNIREPLDKLKIGSLSLIQILDKAPLVPKDFEECSSPLAVPSAYAIGNYALSILFDNTGIQTYLEGIGADQLLPKVCEVLHDQKINENNLVTAKKLEAHPSCKEKAQS